MVSYIKGKHYKGLGTYIEIRTTYTSQQEKIVEHLFDTGGRDTAGAAMLKRIKING
tara:strand:- start:370 stop:537 length:168 start_codon:yes stop_codon:yes gene_type:complete